MTTTKPELIQSASEMDVLLARLEGCSLIAVDTEFIRETTYYPQLALVQVATDSIVACIDPLAFDARDALKKIFLEPGITRIFHSCSQDMEVLFYYLGKTPISIYDTQIANALLDENHQIGYASLVERELGVQLDKSQTRTNWLQRPLTDKQLAYAGDDVIYLYRLHEILDQRLDLSGRKSWFDEETTHLNNQLGNFQIETDSLWKRVKGSNKLPRDKLAIVQYIAEWREQLAQREDKTRRRVLADDIVIRLAIEAVDDIHLLDAVLGPRYRFDETDKLVLLTAIENATRSSPESWPDNRFSLLDNEQKRLLKTLQQSINDKADELGISSAVLASRKDLEKIILTTVTEHDSNKGSRSSPTKKQHARSILTDVETWRYQLFGQRLTEIIKQAAEKPE